jgi:hypothetical protein
VGNITAAWLNGIIANTNTVLGTTVSSVSTGQRITSSIFSNLITTAQNAAAAAGYDLNWPPLTSVAVGQKITLLAFPPPVDLPTNYETVRWTVPGTYTWVVPTAIPAITAVCFNWIIAGGGSGGSGTQGASGGGGGGGGSGGNHQYSVVPCKTGDKFSVTIGAGGAVGTFGGGGAGLQGQAGGSTIVALNGQVIYQATGGAGGLACLNTTAGGSLKTPGGIGGSFNSTIAGLQGQTGPAGTSDTASSYGGAGAPGAMAGSYGGAGGTTGGGDSYTGASAGSAGVGYGSGGGAGGCKDRSGGIGQWAGGAGACGYAEMTFPSNGATGGTAAANNSAYSVNALVGGAVGGGYSGGTGLAGSGKNGSGITP